MGDNCFNTYFSTTVNRINAPGWTINSPNVTFSSLTFNSASSSGTVYVSTTVPSGDLVGIRNKLRGYGLPTGWDVKITP
jgi:hypothetical protein